MDASRTVFRIAVTLIALLTVFGAGMYSAATGNLAYQLGRLAVTSVVLTFRELQNFTPGGRPIHFLQPALRPGDGVTANRTTGDDLVLLTGFFDGGNEARLITRDGTPVARWPVRFSDHFPDTSHMVDPPGTDWNIDIHGAALNPDGSVVLNLEYGGAVKLDRCGGTVWRLAHPAHHSVERAEGGGYWIPGRAIMDPALNRYPPFTRLAGVSYFQDDLILRVGEDGAILTAKPVMELLIDNGLLATLTATGDNFSQVGEWDREFIHLNKIAELPAALAPAFPMFQAGDLMLSLRNYNMVLVVDPDTWAIRWHQTGPWLRQHDPEFLPSGEVAVFDNGVFIIDEGIQKTLSEPIGGSRVVAVDPGSGTVRHVFGDGPGQEVLTVIRGKVDPGPGGGVMVTEFEGGRIVEADGDGRIVWEYINRFDDAQVLELTEARAYDRDYFDVTDWSCPL